MYDVTRRDHVSVVMDAGSRIVNFIVNIIRDGMQCSHNSEIYNIVGHAQWLRVNRYPLQRSGSDERPPIAYGAKGGGGRGLAWDLLQHSCKCEGSVALTWSLFLLFIGGGGGLTSELLEMQPEDSQQTDFCSLRGMKLFWRKTPWKWQKEKRVLAYNEQCRETKIRHANNQWDHWYGAINVLFTRDIMGPSSARGKCRSAPRPSTQVILSILIMIVSLDPGLVTEYIPQEFSHYATVPTKLEFVP